MVIYLNDALHVKMKEKGDALSLADLRSAVMQGALLRLRPKVMTVSTIVKLTGHPSPCLLGGTHRD
jgi:Cu(I)/Ag(I) efflux system membrane protein CusA/SilA